MRGPCSKAKNFQTRLKSIGQGQGLCEGGTLEDHAGRMSLKAELTCTTLGCPHPKGPVTSYKDSSP